MSGVLFFVMILFSFFNLLVKPTNFNNASYNPIFKRIAKKGLYYVQPNLYFFRRDS